MTPVPGQVWNPRKEKEWYEGQEREAGASPLWGCTISSSEEIYKY